MLEIIMALCAVQFYLGNTTQEQKMGSPEKQNKQTNKQTKPTNQKNQTKPKPQLDILI